MGRLGSLCIVVLLSGIASAQAQPASFSREELRRARAAHPLEALSLDTKPGRGPRRSLSRQQLRTLATAARGVMDGTPVIGVTLHLDAGHGASQAASQTMANEIVRQLEALGCARGSIVAIGFGADYRQTARNRARGIRNLPASRVELFRVPTGGMPVTLSVRFREDVTPFVRSFMPRLLSCAPAGRFVMLRVTFDENGRITQVDGGASEQERMCYRVNLVGETIGTAPGQQQTVMVPLELRRP